MNKRYCGNTIKDNFLLDNANFKNQSATLKRKHKSKFLLSLSGGCLLLTLLSGCDTKKCSEIDFSFLKDYSAEITDAKRIGLTDGTFVKQDANGNIKPINFKARPNKKSAGLAPKGKVAVPSKDILTQDDLRANLLQYNVYGNLTFVKYAPRFEDCTFYDYEGKKFDGKDGRYGLYYKRYGKQKEYFGNVIEVKDGAISYVVDDRYYTNEIYQSFVIDNNTGYIYPLDFLYYTNLRDIYDGMSNENVEKSDGFIQFHGNSLRYYVNDDRAEFCFYGTDMLIDIVDDKLVMKELGLMADLKDKYNQYYLFNDQMSQSTKIYEKQKTMANALVIPNDEGEAIGVGETGLFKFRDGFEREACSMQNGEIFFRDQRTPGSNYVRPFGLFRGLDYCFDSYNGNIDYKQISFYLNDALYTFLWAPEGCTGDPLVYGCVNRSMPEEGRWVDDLGWELANDSRNLLLPNFDSKNVLDDDFGQYLYIRNDTLYVMPLSQYMQEGFGEHREFTPSNPIKIMDNVLSIQYECFTGSDDCVIKILDNNIFGQNEYYLYLSGDSYEIKLAKEYVPTQKEYQLTPINN